MCKVHHHHVYWRFDFDIGTAANNIVPEYNNVPLSGANKWHSKLFEMRRPRDAARERRWRIKNATTGDSYLLVPGPNDGAADSFGVGDVWILRYRGSEIDDGQGFTTDPILAKADLDRFINHERVDGQDVVVWYAAHFTHAVSHEPHDGPPHIVGPDIRPESW